MTQTKTFLPTGVCSRQYEITVTDGKIDNISVVGGCNGNLKGLASLLRGMEIQDAVQRMSGLRCGDKPTSCPDQIARALREMQTANSEK
ncbi:MAG: TIGR03905 family TSCPD domain-containing protein [Clostridia bacterium]|nr:TIGR03905 family TSCPD domain-containing protein [Clostridia bacterium]